MIELEPLKRSDLPLLASWGGQSEFLIQWAGPIFDHPLDEKQLEKYFDAMEASPDARKMYKAVRVGSEEMVGHIELDRINPKTGSAIVEHVIVGDPAMRGKGVGGLMMKKILEVGFGQLGLHRISLNVYDFNHSAIACYEKAGFIKEGLLREAVRVGNQYWSVFLMSVLETEWRSLQAAG